MKPLIRLGVIALLAALTLSGCESIGVALGLRTRLDQVPVTALSASLLPDPGLAPGKKAKLILVASTADGKNLTTVGAGRGTVLFDSFIFQPTIVQVNDGVVSMPADPRVSEGQTPPADCGGGSSGSDDGPGSTTPLRCGLQGPLLRRHR